MPRWEEAAIIAKLLCIRRCLKDIYIRTVGSNKVSDMSRGISNKNHNKISMIEIGMIPDTNF